VRSSSNLPGQRLTLNIITTPFDSGVAMPISITEVGIQALQLSLEDRAELADTLLASLSAGHGIDESWAVEAERRLAELESGSVGAIPVEAAIARAREAIR
jgi:putative addiction module component (TIGR02574 family)